MHLVSFDRALAREFLQKRVMDCKVAPLRFRVGDDVAANCEGWTRDKIIKLWDEGNPYRTRLLDEEGWLSSFKTCKKSPKKEAKEVVKLRGPTGSQRRWPRGSTRGPRHRPESRRRQRASASDRVIVIDWFGEGGV